MVGQYWVGYMAGRRDVRKIGMPSVFSLFFHVLVVFEVGSICIAEMAYSVCVQPVLGCYQSSVSFAVELT